MTRYEPDQNIFFPAFSVPTCCGMGYIYMDVKDLPESEFYRHVVLPWRKPFHPEPLDKKDLSFFIRNNPIANLVRIVTNSVIKNNLFVVRDEDIPFVRDFLRILGAIEYDHNNGHTIFLSIDTKEVARQHFEKNGFLEEMVDVPHDKAFAYGLWLASHYCEDAAERLKRYRKDGY